MAGIFGELLRQAPAGLAAVTRGRMVGAENRRQREREDARDAQIAKREARADEMAALERALTMANLSDAGIHQGEAPVAPNPASAAASSIGANGGIDPVSIALAQGMAGLEGERYETLSPGYYRDRMNTPQTRATQAAMDRQRAEAATHRSTYDATAGRFGEESVGPYSPGLDYQDLYEKILSEQGTQSRADATNKTRLDAARIAAAARGGSGGGSGGAGGGVSGAGERDKSMQGMALMNRYRANGQDRIFGAKMGELMRANPGMDAGLAAYYADQELNRGTLEPGLREAATTVMNMTEEDAVSALQSAGYNAQEIGAILDMVRGATPEVDDGFDDF